jgi:5-methylcytosine-specific restriction endonuclease McrA
MKRYCSKHGIVSTNHRCTPKARRNQRLRSLVAASAAVCPECGVAPTLANPMTADHVVQQRDGGQDEWSNLRPRCKSCNSRRGSR